MKFNWNNIEEPIRSIANRVVIIIASLSGLLTVLNQLVDLLPANQKATVSAILLGAGAIFAVVTKVAAELGRAKVTPTVKAQGDVLVAQAASLRRP